jgi:cyclophilin family peptidyl-prolyl cis-trans isomerase
MKKYFILLIIIIALNSACAQNKTMTYDENSAPAKGINKDELSAMQRLNDIKNGATPKVKPTGDTSSAPQAPPVPPTPKQSQKAYATSLADLGYQDLRNEYRSAVIKTNLGDITVEFYGDDSPLTVNNFLNLAKKGFYDGIRFHRIIDDFMIQAGDPNSKEEQFRELWGTGGPGYKFADEFNDRPLEKGSFAMANAGPNTNGSQFFIVTKDFTPWLDGKHTNFGRVTSGMDVVEKIEAIKPAEDGKPSEDAVIEEVELIEK